MKNVRTSLIITGDEEANAKRARTCVLRAFLAFVGNFQYKAVHRDVAVVNVAERHAFLAHEFAENGRIGCKPRAYNPAMIIHLKDFLLVR